MTKSALFSLLLVALPPSVTLDDYVYKEDPCVEALRYAMESMEPFIPQRFTRDGDIWIGTVMLTKDGVEERRDADEVWREAKLQCWRH